MQFYTSETKEKTAKNRSKLFVESIIYTRVNNCLPLLSTIALLRRHGTQQHKEEFMTSSSAASVGGKTNWWRVVFPFKRRGSRDQLNVTPRSHAVAAPQPRRFTPGVWLQSGWMSTAPVRARAWDTTIYIYMMGTPTSERSVSLIAPLRGNIIYSRQTYICARGKRVVVFSKGLFKLMMAAW